MSLCLKHRLSERWDKMAIQLKAARVNANLTQQQVAEILGVSKQTIVNYELYRTIPDIEMSKKLAKLYNLSVDDIIFFKE